jgi:arabinogalactan endo-1,4-beta-galactosidase
MRIRHVGPRLPEVASFAAALQMGSLTRALGTSALVMSALTACSTQSSDGTAMPDSTATKDGAATNDVAPTSGASTGPVSTSNGPASGTTNEPGGPTGPSTSGPSTIGPSGPSGALPTGSTPTSSETLPTQPADTQVGETSDATGETTNAGDQSSGETVGPVEPTFLIGADLSSIPEALDSGAVYIDTDGQQKDILDLLKNHGFNAVRLRTFVDPSAPYGYAAGDGGSCRKSKPYNNAAETVAFGAKIKAAGMKLLVDFHYSDTWADPGKQIIPEAWRSATTIDQFANHIREYTTSVLTQLVEAGAKPDMVQVGNETTPGMLIHVPGPNTDCWGNQSAVRSGVTGRASNDNWDNLARLLDAGADAVHAVDPGIKVVLHIESTDDVSAVRWWVNSAVTRNVSFDVLGLSAYTAFQGQPSVWKNTLETMAKEFPQLSFIIAEYNPERTQANRIVHGLPDGRGLGTFFWEPTLSGSWGESMFTVSGNRYTARPADFAEYDALRGELGL